VYCQLGRTKKKRTHRQKWYKPSEILKLVKEKVENVEKLGEPIDYLTFVPDGEPTLDMNLGLEIENLRSLGIKIAVITNSSLLWQEDVREALRMADLVSIKIDTIRKEIWNRIDRPHKSLDLDIVLRGVREFAATYNGDLITETMLVRGLNDNNDDVEEVANFLAQINPSKAYLSIPTRPPTEKWVQPPFEEVLNSAYQIFNDEIESTEYLIGYEGNAFVFTGNVEEDILSITSVHPMREDAVRAFLAKANAKWSVINLLLEKKQLLEIEYKGKKFYLRKFALN